VGFFDVMMGTPSEGSSNQGFGELPGSMQNLAKNTALGTSYFVSPYNKNNGGVQQQNIDRFTPLGVTADETMAFDRMREGFAPTQETLASDIAMQMNPYDQFVIDEINRQAQDEYSLMNQYMSEAGQLGSNRAGFGAAEAERVRQQNIGLFKQDQYNTALDRALGRITDIRRQDTQNLRGIGDFERGLDLQTKQAPVTALNAAAGLMGGSGISGAVSKTGIQKQTGAQEGIMDKASNMAAAVIPG
jgi:hypothetical protein